MATSRVNICLRTTILCKWATRLGELLALSWSDIDFNERLIHVRRNRTAGQVGTPKSGKSRKVDVSQQLTNVLKSLLVERKAEKLKKGWKELPEIVFCGTGGGPLDADNLRHRVFYKVVKKAEIGELRIHDLRHSYASMLIANGESLAYVRDQLGHSSIKVTVDLYGHLVPGGSRQAVDRLDTTVTLSPSQASEETQQSATPPQPSMTEDDAEIAASC